MSKRLLMLALCNLLDYKKKKKKKKNTQFWIFDSFFMVLKNNRLSTPGEEVVWARPRDHHSPSREGAGGQQRGELPALHHRGAHPQLAPLLGGAVRAEARQYAPWALV